MFIFLKLVLAHMIADFILQFEELYQLKLKSQLGHLAHAFFHGLVSFILLAPYLSDPVIVFFIIAVSLIHYFQDQIKYSIQAKHPKQIFWCFTLDQIGHFLFLAAIFFFPAAQVEKGFPASAHLDLIYRDPSLTLYLILFISIGFKAAYFLHAFRRTFIPETRPDHSITSFEMAWGIAERSLIVFCYLHLSPLIFIISLTPGLARLSSKKMCDLLDFCLSYVYASFAGWLFSHWL